MKIGILAPYTRPLDIDDAEGSGINVFVRESARALARQGHIVTVYVRASRSYDCDTLCDESGMRVKYVDAGAREKLNRESVYQTCCEEDFPVDEVCENEVIIAHYWIAQAWVQKIHRRFFGKVFYFSHSFFLDPFRLSAEHHHQVAESWLCSHGVVWCAMTQAEYNVMRKVLGSEKVLLLPSEKADVIDHFARGFEEFVMQSEVIYRGAVMTVKRMPRKFKKAIIPYESVQFNGSVHVIPITDSEQMIFIKERRVSDIKKGYQTRVLSGILEAGENPEMAARRELQEEIGITAQEMTILATFSKNDAIENKRYYFVARGLKGDIKACGDETEDIDGVAYLSKDEVCRQVRQGLFGSGETAMALLKICGAIDF